MEIDQMFLIEEGVRFLPKAEHHQECEDLARSLSRLERIERTYIIKRANYLARELKKYGDVNDLYYKVKKRAAEDQYLDSSDPFETKVPHKIRLQCYRPYEPTPKSLVDGSVTIWEPYYMDDFAPDLMKIQGLKKFCRFGDLTKHKLGFAFKWEDFDRVFNDIITTIKSGAGKYIRRLDDTRRD